MKQITYLVKYIKYLFISKSRYSIHSPFIYDFITNVMGKKEDSNNFTEINKLRQALSNNHTVIEITDYGAGSKINSSKKRKVSDIAKNSAKSSKYGELIYRIVSYYEPKHTLELGTSLGVSACYLSKAYSDGHVKTIEGCPKTAKIAKNNFSKMGVKNITVEIGNFDDNLSNTLATLNTIDLFFVDGNHQQESTIKYFEEGLLYSNNNTIMIFDDIHWSKGMETAWNYIKTHEKTKVTIDLFFIGIVFLKKELSKENFIIRF